MEKEIYVSVVAPVYNEENTIEAFHERLAKTLQHMNVSYEIIFVLDPCTDSTELKVTELMKKDRNVKMIVTSRRFGQPACTIAGIANCSGSLCFVIDADLQDPPELMPEMLEKWKEGYKVVYAKRASIKGETLLKRFVSRIGYYIIEKMSDIKIPRDTGDFRLLDRDVIDHIKEFKEHDAFLRGITAYIGFKQTYVTYNRDPRAAGAGKYNKYTGSLRIGMNGILNFSKIPLYAIIITGIIIIAADILVLFFTVPLSGLMGKSNFILLTVVLFLAGLQLLSLGIIAQYFARIFYEVKGRPGIIIDKMVGFRQDNDIKRTQYL